MKLCHVNNSNFDFINIPSQKLENKCFGRYRHRVKNYFVTYVQMTRDGIVN